MKCKNKWIWNMFKWTFYFYFHLLPLDKSDLCKTGTLNVHSWVIKVIVNRRFWINYIMMKKKRKRCYKSPISVTSITLWRNRKNYKVSFESPDIRYHGSSFWTRCETINDVYLDLNNCRYSIGNIIQTFLVYVRIFIRTNVTCKLHVTKYIISLYFWSI
jgi:hypothetical protein